MRQLTRAELVSKSEELLAAIRRIFRGADVRWRTVVGSRSVTIRLESAPFAPQRHRRKVTT